MADSMITKKNAAGCSFMQKEINSMNAIQFAVEAAPSFLAKTEQRPSGIDEFPALLNTKGWKFSRDEARPRTRRSQDTS
jgi:hypothetical protein